MSTIHEHLNSMAPWLEPIDLGFQEPRILEKRDVSPYIGKQLHLAVDILIESARNVPENELRDLIRGVYRGNIADEQVEHKIGFVNKGVSPRISIPNISRRYVRGVDARYTPKSPILPPEYRLWMFTYPYRFLLPKEHDIPRVLNPSQSKLAIGPRVFTLFSQRPCTDADIEYVPAVIVATTQLLLGKQHHNVRATHNLYRSWGTKITCNGRTFNER